MPTLVLIEASLYSFCRVVDGSKVRLNDEEDDEGAALLFFLLFEGAFESVILMLDMSDRLLACLLVVSCHEVKKCKC